MADAQCAGLELADGLDDGDVPLAALVVLKVLCTDGRVGYQVRATDDLSSVEALGMAHHAVVRLTRVLSEED